MKKSSLLVLLLASVGTAACAGNPTTANHQTAKPVSWSDGSKNVVQMQKLAATNADADAGKHVKVNEESYSLNIGDTVKITTYGHEDLSGEFKVESNGKLNMPLVGDIRAEGKTQKQLENDIRAHLASGYLVDPKVAIEVAKFRQFYIVGEVDEPGAYDYVPSLNVIKAVAIAGGFTHRAVTDKFTVVRTKGSTEQKFATNEEATVLPGDTIRVDERFF